MQVSERIEMVDGVEMYRISNVDAMDPFLMTIVSSSDLWMFVSTTGGLTAGRIGPADCIFPYETVDRLHAAGGRIGPVTELHVRNEEGTTVWEPFRSSGPHQRRSLFKSLLGTAVVFQEEHLELGLTFRYRWAPSDRFGWVRTSTLVHDGSEPPPSVEVIDGLLGVMPWGIDVVFQQRLSNLGNAYRRSEVTGSGMALYTLEAVISDRPEPSEALRATTVWSTGLEGAAISVDATSLSGVGTHKPAEPVTLLTGRPGAFLLQGRVELEPGGQQRWHISADVAKDHAAIAQLNATLASGEDLSALVEEDIAASAGQLRGIVAGADGIHATGSTKNDAHHFANTLFNVMRGGTFVGGQYIDADHFRDFVAGRNRPLAERHAGWLDDLPESIAVRHLRSRARQTGDCDLYRLADEYLPIGFSRRHGDPSRPWNAFTIRVRDDQGNPVLSYEGNWRDIFQNWEALCRTFPTYIESVISKFLNASTADGFNPYRITSEGIDWEVPEPDNPWSGIGYWGDHQIVYLLRLLEAQEAHKPGSLEGQLTDSGFGFADVPYRIAPYDALVANPKATVEFDEAAEAATAQRVAEIGADGKLLADAGGDIIHVTFLEKLLIPMLAKLSNFVPRGGIWMNTERPEWNDANNALVGYGLSMVTLSYLIPYVDLIKRLVSAGDEDVPVSPEVIAWITGVTEALESGPAPGEGADIDPADRARTVHALGTAFDLYRSAVYQHGLSKPQPLVRESVQRLCEAALGHLTDALRNARRPDGLYHSYNLLRFSDDGAEAHVSHLPEMLEGQVAAISSGVLDAGEVAALLRDMYASPLYREDVDTFLLYPATIPPPFLEKNRIPQELVESNPLLASLADAGAGDVVVRDIEGHHHFDADFRNAGDLAAALDRLVGTELEGLMQAHRAATLDVFEQVFNHHAFTGRSSTMYAFEGIGSVYWHMVAKLLLAVQEAVLRADGAAEQDELDDLIALYFRVQDGLGYNRTAAEFGAFPTDPYSHTPAHAGAQQPGMTGQVKEELLTRWAELGVTISDGCIVFTPLLLSDEEFRSEPGTLHFRAVTGEEGALEVGSGQVGLTLCQVPVIVQLTDGEGHIIVESTDGATRRVEGLRLDPDTSTEVFHRTNEVARLDVSIPRS